MALRKFLAAAGLMALGTLAGCASTHPAKTSIASPPPPSPATSAAKQQAMAPGQMTTTPDRNQPITNSQFGLNNPSFPTAGSTQQQPIMPPPAPPPSMTSPTSMNQSRLGPQGAATNFAANGQMGESGIMQVSATGAPVPFGAQFGPDSGPLPSPPMIPTGAPGNNVTITSPYVPQGEPGMPSTYRLQQP